MHACRSALISLLAACAVCAQRLYRRRGTQRCFVIFPVCTLHGGSKVDVSQLIAVRANLPAYIDVPYNTACAVSVGLSWRWPHLKQFSGATSVHVSGSGVGSLLALDGNGRSVCMLQALAATTRSVLSGNDTSKDATAREILAASAPAIQVAITQGVYGSGQGRQAIMEHQVATMQS